MALFIFQDERFSFLPMLWFAAATAVLSLGIATHRRRKGPRSVGDSDTAPGELSDLGAM
jgi:hypothetical protein